MPKTGDAVICTVVMFAAFACFAAGGVADFKKTVQRRVEPAAVETRIPGRTLVDFGEEAFGFLELVPPAGARGPYEVRLGEMVKSDGSVNMNPGATIRAARVTGSVDTDGVVRVPLVADRRNTSGGREGGAILIPPEHGVIMPFRYVEVMKAPFEITKETIRMVAVNYPMDLSESSFACSDERLNRVYELCRHTILVSSFAGLYVDGDRERIPYEADAYINQLSDYAVHSDYSLARASHVYLMKHPTWPTEWKQHSIFMAWADWMWSGDTGALEEFYGQLRGDRLMERFRRDSDGLLATGGERIPGKLVNANGAADIVDWPHCERDGFVFMEVNAVVNAFYYRNLLQVSEFARILGKSGDAEFYGSRARAVRKACNEAFFDERRGVYRDGIGTDHASLHANAAALAFGLVSGPDAKRVAAYCISKGMACSVYFAQYLLEGLFNAGEADAAIALMTSDGDRSWLGMLEQGATTTMEAWSVKYKPNLDLCHAWGTAPLNIISRYVLGVTPLEPGFAKIRVRPQVGSLARVEGTVPTAKGAVKVRIEDGVLALDLPAPARVEWRGAVRDVPAGKVVMSSGERTVVGAPSFFQGCSTGSENRDASLLVGTYNIRLMKGDKDTPNAWDERKDDLVDEIRRLDMDVFGMQEVFPEQAFFITNSLPQYVVVGEYREADRVSGEASPVCCRRDRFEVLKSGTFWLSETPDVPGVKGWGAACPRICSWALLKDRRSGASFVFANTHTDHKSELARKEGMLLVIRRMREFAPEGTPIVFTGDHNCRETEEPALAVGAILTNALYAWETPPTGPWRASNGGAWRDSEYSTVDALKLQPHVRNARKGSPDADKDRNGGHKWEDCGARIDYIYVSRDVKVKSYETHGDQRPGKQLYPSDHFPVSARIELPAPAGE